MNSMCHLDQCILSLGIGYKGEIVNVPRELAYTELLPARLALYTTPENVALFEEERKLLVDRPQVSPFVAKCRDYLKTIVLQIPINTKLQQWSLDRTNIRIALRRLVRMRFMFNSIITLRSFFF